MSNTQPGFEGSALDYSDIPNTPEVTAALQNPELQRLKEETHVIKEVKEKLAKVVSAKQRVMLYAKYVDKYGLDVVVGLFPALGDLSSSTVSGVYLLTEAARLGMSKIDMLKIIALQAGDGAIGVIPVAGDAMDYMWKANKWSVKYFQKLEDKVVEEARKLGVPEEQIKQIKQKGSTLPMITEKIVTLGSLGKTLKMGKAA